LRTLIQERSEKMLSSLRDGPLGRLIARADEEAADDARNEPNADDAASTESAPEDRPSRGRVKETLDQLQMMLDARVEAVVPAMRTIRELRAEVDALRKRVDELEKRQPPG
jgi:hypothetical protein